MTETVCWRAGKGTRNLDVVMWSDCLLGMIGLVRLCFLTVSAIYVYNVGNYTMIVR